MSAAPQASAPSGTARQNADNLFDQGDFVAAEGLFRKLAEEPGERSWATFQLGRTARRLERPHEALEWFDACLGEANPVAWARFERASILFEIGEQDRAVADLAVFALDPPDGFSKGHRPLLLKAAEFAFSRRDTTCAGRLFGLLVERFEDDAHARLRQADVLLMEENPGAALEMIAPIGDDPGRSGWVDLVRARALVALGRPGEAAVVLLNAKPEVSAQPYVARLLVNVIDTLQSTGAAAPPEVLAALTAGQQKELELRDALRMVEPERIALVLSGGGQADASLLPAVADALDRLMLKGEYVGLEAIGAILPASFAADPRILSIRLCAAFARKRWADAGSLVALAQTTLGSTESAELRLRILEYFCFTMRLDEADEHLASFENITALDPARPVVASLHAARGRWAQVIALAGESVAARRSIDHPTFLEALGRATRRTARYIEVLELLDAAIANTGGERLGEFADRLSAEFCLHQETGRPGPTGEASGILDGAEGNARPAPQHRQVAQSLALQIKALRRSPPAPLSRSVLLCSDLNYLLGTSVAAFSLLHNNPGLRAGLKLTVVSASETMALAGSVFAAIGRAFGVAIEVRPETSIMTAPAELQTGWGLFTPGHSLSAAAYWRIYAARCLLAEGHTGRLLYIDSDTMVGPNLEDLIDRDLGGEPLGARPELAIPEIVHAAIGLGIDPDLYFNSGVLLFDLDCNDLPALLDSALEISTCRPEILTFVDQCALNLAFKGRSAVLDQRCNDYVRQRTTPNLVGEATVVTHYLDRPKPWDPMYRGLNGQPWLREWGMLSGFLLPDDRRALMSAALRW